MKHHMLLHLLPTIASTDKSEMISESMSLLEKSVVDLSLTITITVHSVRVIKEFCEFLLVNDALQLPPEFEDIEMDPLEAAAFLISVLQFIDSDNPESGGKP